MCPPAEDGITSGDVLPTRSGGGGGGCNTTGAGLGLCLALIPFMKKR
jgi:hypothetical protein